VLKAGGIPLIQVVKTLEQCGFLIILLTILSLACLRGVYLAQGAHNRAPILTSPLVSSLSTPFDNLVLIFCAGLVGISQYLVLLFLYQTAYGSLFLEMGLITGVTMAGIYGGAALVGKLLTHREHEPRLLLILCLGSHALFLVSLCSLEAILPKGLYVLLFLMAGAFTGIYFPLVAYRYQLQGAPNLLAGSRIEAVDHLGGAVGAFLTGILLLPLFGKNAVVQILILMIAVQAVPFFFRKRTAVGIILSPFDIQVRRVGYLLFGIGLVLLVSSQIVVYSRQGLYQEKFHQAALSLSASQTLELKEKNSRAGRHLVFYTYLSAKDQLTHYVLDSANLGVSTKGFAGLIHLALDVTERGDLAGFRIIESQETPAYLNLLRDWYTRLTGRNLFGPDPFQGIDAVTGATLSSTAIKHTLAAAGIDLKREILELPDEEGDRAMAQTPWRVELRLVCLLLAMCGALFLRWSPGYWRRLAYLTGILLVLGWWLNVQYSTQQVFLLLTVRGLIPDWSAPFFLIVVVPLLVLLMGNIYCGYLCPFGALQELIGELRPLRIKTEVGKGVWRYGRLSKYGLLFMVVVFFSLTRDDRILGVDPLISFFGQVREPIAWILGIGVLLASFFYRRFWCRTLCPAGAFLALLNGVALFRKYLPQSVPANCDLGVRRREEIDCLCCDRCRHEPE
jgi:Na+-translocating ferredoxin:NAD+ oxidoreductase RnfG subunit